MLFLVSIVGKVHVPSKILMLELKKKYNGLMRQGLLGSDQVTKISPIQLIFSIVFLYSSYR